MNFIIYDLMFLVVFAIIIGTLLYSKRKNIKKEGLLLLYKAKWGMKLIDYIGGKYKKTLKFLSYISIVLGYFLMVAMVYLFGKIIYIYVVMPSVVRAIKIPPIMPLIPYIDKVVPNLGLPPFYFTYWIIILALIAIPHEFFHGIFMKRYGVKIKSTGFGFFPFFLPIFLAAFVEQDEKSFVKASNFKQMAILSAGTFANILTAIFFFIIMFLFFSVAFVPAGITFDNYAYSGIAISGISMINNITLENPSYQKVLDLIDEEGFNEIFVGEEKYFLTKSLIEKQEEGDLLFVYDDAPAIRNNIQGAIRYIEHGENYVIIENFEDLSIFMAGLSPGDVINITTSLEDKSRNSYYNIKLEENPVEEGKAWLGIGFVNQKRSGVIGKIYNLMSSFKKPHVYYEPRYDGFSEFIYNLLWWIVLICISVALVNMLPVGIFDGGRFFYLTILVLTKSESAAKKSFKFVTWFFLFLVAVLMAFWLISFI